MLVWMEKQKVQFQGNSNEVVKPTEAGEEKLEEATTPEIPIRQARLSRETGEKETVFIDTVLYSLIT